MADDSRLVMSQGPQSGQTFHLEKDSTGLGRDPGNDITIDNPQVSRQHARITRQGGLMVVEDLGSTNGTFVNGMRLTGPHTLVSGDMIGLGDAVVLTYYETGIAATEIITGRLPAAPSPPSYIPSPAAPESPSPPAYVATPPPDASPVEEEKSRAWLWVGCGCLTLILFCAAVGLFVWYAPSSFWQTLIDLGIPLPTWPF
ncbi:MAG: FHA domain-containing protein [Chloroflexota bacterium]|nr:FHA domain-containing protein [Chloroflexota bacterium]